MSPVELNKLMCRPVEFRDEGPQGIHNVTGPSVYRVSYGDRWGPGVYYLVSNYR